jgi:Domain of unknown function (DUF4062)
VSPRPTIFISAVTAELGSARQLVANTLTFLGYEPTWQDVFGTETGDLCTVLREKIDQCKGVVQLVGQCYGAEPASKTTEFGRVSFTQYEALYARKQGKKVWYLFIDKDFPIDPHDAEPEEVRQLQSSYRNVLKADTHMFHPLSSREALEAGVLKLRDDLTVLRRGAKQWAIGVATALVFIAILAIWLVWGQAGIKQKIAAEGRSMEMIAKHFDSLAANSGLIPSPKTPEEHYHNARVQELSGNFAAARNEYSEYLSANLEALDPWLSYETMLKSAEGHAGAIESMRSFEKLSPRTVSHETALALLDEGDARLTKLQALAASHSDFGPLPWLISQEFSESRKGEQTLADQRSEKQWLEKFREAQAAGKFEKYFIDKNEAQRWIDAADARWAKLSSRPEGTMKNPVTMTLMESNGGWSANFQLVEYTAKELFYKVDGHGDFQSTGHLPMRNSQTGEQMLNLNVPLPNLAEGEHTMEVKYLDKAGNTNGPYTLKFSTEAERLAQTKWSLNSTSNSWLEFRDFNGKALLYFSQILSYRVSIKEIRYSLNSDALDKEFKFDHHGNMFEPGDNTYITVPRDTQFAVAQITYLDGTTSSVQKFMRANRISK